MTSVADLGDEALDDAHVAVQPLDLGRFPVAFAQPLLGATLSHALALLRLAPLVTGGVVGGAGLPGRLRSDVVCLARPFQIDALGVETLLELGHFAGQRVTLRAPIKNRLATGQRDDAVVRDDIPRQRDDAPASRQRAAKPSALR